MQKKKQIHPIHPALMMTLGVSFMIFFLTVGFVQYQRKRREPLAVAQYTNPFDVSVQAYHNPFADEFSAGKKK